MLLFCTHHIAFDAWSAQVFIGELARLLSLPAGADWPSLPDLPLQYADYAAWQRTWIEGPEAQAQLAFWQKILAEAPPPLELSGDRARPAHPSYRGAAQRVPLQAQQVQALRRLGQQERATLYMLLFAAFLVLLRRLTGQTDLLIGAPVAGRRHAASETLIGMFVNSLPLRFDLSGSPAFRELLRRVQQVVLAGLAHQDLPFERLVQALQAGAFSSRTPFFQIMFNLRNVPGGSPSAGALQIEPYDFDDRIAQFDLSVEIEPRQAGLVCDFVYSADLFDGETIRRMAQRYQLLLEAILADPEQNIERLPILLPEERALILGSWNATQRASRANPAWRSSSRPGPGRLPALRL